MTSGRLFFKVMREDLRHKIWMIALSALGNFIAWPVTWLLLATYYDVSGTALRREEFFTKAFYGIMKPASLSTFVFGGFVCILIALVTGLFGFRYVFRADMVDTYHSLPVKRKTLYGACYLNGILIWLIPFALCMAPTFVMMCNYARWLERMLGALAPGVEIGAYQNFYLDVPLWTVLAKEMVLNILVLAVVYLLVYHVALTAVMLSGNILNALVSMVIMGFGVVGIYGLGVSFFSFYLDTFVQNSEGTIKAIYASPLCSAIRLIYDRAQEETLTVVLAVNLGVAVLLGLCAYILYRKRASETAEQGITNKAVAALLRMVASVCVGMLGWLILGASFAESQRALWGSFGAVLAAGLAAGILDIIFQMDFGAFFAHKCQMAAGILLSLLLCGAFYGDWFGYDTYLPKKEQIAYIAVSDWNLSSKAFYQNQEMLLENMRYQDIDVIYAWLERMTQDRQRLGPTEYVDVKVTLKNGRSYYRRYTVQEEEKDLLWPILTSEEYMKYAYLIDEDLVDESTVNIQVTGGSSSLRTAEEFEGFRRILRAYNRDVLEHPESVLRGNRVRALIEFDIRLGKEGAQAAYVGYGELVIYEGMEYSVEALREEGFGKLIADKEPEKIKAIIMNLDYSAKTDMTVGEVIEMAGVVFGVPTESQEAAEESKPHVGGLAIRITDPEEVAELSELLSFIRPRRVGRVFQKDYKSVEVIDWEGNKESWYIQKGTLPEKYILRFGGD